MPVGLVNERYHRFRIAGAKIDNQFFHPDRLKYPGKLSAICKPDGWHALGKRPNACMHPGAKKEIASPNHCFHFVLLEVPIQNVQVCPQFISCLNPNITACRHIAFTVLSENMRYENDMSIMFSDEETDKIVNQTAVVRFQLKHVIPSIAPNVQKPTYVQSYPLDVRVFFEKVRRNSFLQMRGSNKNPMS